MIQDSQGFPEGRGSRGPVLPEGRLRRDIFRIQLLGQVVQEKYAALVHIRADCDNNNTSIGLTYRNTTVL